MKRQIKAALLVIFLLSGLAAHASAQYQGSVVIPQQQIGHLPGSAGTSIVHGAVTLQGPQIRTPVTDMRYRGPVTDMRYRGPETIRYSGGPAIPGRDFLQGNVPTPFPTQPVPGQNIRPTPGIPSQPFPGQNIQFPGQPISGLPRNIQMPQPQNRNLWHHNERQNIVGGTYRDGHGGTIQGSIDGVTQGNLEMGVDSQFAGVRGEVRGGIEAQGRVDQQHDIYGMPVNQYASGNVFLGTEAQAQAGLSREGLGVGAGGFAGARAQMTRGVDLGVVDVSQTIEGQVGVGAEANAHLGLQNGRLRLNGELGAAVGIGAKMGVDTEVDLGEAGRFVERSAPVVDRWGQQAGRDISRTTHNTYKGAERKVNNVHNQAKRTVNKAGNQAKRTVNKAGNSIKKFGKSIFGK